MIELWTKDLSDLHMDELKITYATSKNSICNMKRQYLQHRKTHQNHLVVGVKFPPQHRSFVTALCLTSLEFLAWLTWYNTTSHVWLHELSKPGLSMICVFGCLVCLHMVTSFQTLPYLQDLIPNISSLAPGAWLSSTLRPWKFLSFSFLEIESPWKSVLYPPHQPKGNEKY